MPKLSEHASTPQCSNTLTLEEKQQKVLDGKFRLVHDKDSYIGGDVNQMVNIIVKLVDECGHWT